MSFAAKILADSLSPDGVRLTTFEVTFPRIILAEFNTHRMFSRNSASSRAIPVEKMLARVLDDPYVPTHWGKNQRGMQAEHEVNAIEADAAGVFWLGACREAVKYAEKLREIGIHKQTTNRLLEPFMWHTVIVTATEWSNFFHLRNNAQAHPDIQTIAKMMQELYVGAIREGALDQLSYGDWHLPLVSAEERAGLWHGFQDDPAAFWCRVSVARCARVSYLTHDGKRDIQADLDLHDKLLSSGHLSPFEHVARPAERTASDCSDALISGSIAEDLEDPSDMWFGNFRGWVQYRKLIPNEADILGVRDA